MKSSKTNPGPERLVTQIIMITSLCLFSWLAMMLIHEVGHVLVAILTGGEVQHVTWHPLAFSHTLVHPNPAPHGVVWGGPIIGSVIPLLLIPIFRWRQKSMAYIAEFFTGFCLLANGIYIGIGWVDQVGDTAVMQKHGTSVGVMIAFELLCIPAGLYLWHRISRKVGLAKTSQCTIASKHALLMAVMASLITFISFLFGKTC